jgi:dsRNA-specific ribonuclease
MLAHYFLLQKIRALVVGNSTLADISRMYDLPARLRLHPAQAITLRASVNIQGTFTLPFISQFIERSVPSRRLRILRGRALS